MNNREFDEIVIDPHYREKHSDIDKSTILGLVMSLNGEELQIETQRGKWEYFSKDNMSYLSKRYRLIWCTEVGLSSFGVINCFRR